MSCIQNKRRHISRGSRGEIRLYRAISNGPANSEAMPGAQSQRQRLSPISSAADGRNWSTAARPPPRQGDFRCPSSMAERSGLCPDWRRSLLGKGTGLLCSRVGDGGRPFRLQCAKSAACAISGGFLAGQTGFEPPHGGIKIRTFLTKNNGLHVWIAATLHLGTKAYALFVKPFDRHQGAMLGPWSRLALREAPPR
jgi:hypothetical protein